MSFRWTWPSLVFYFLIWNPQYWFFYPKKHWIQLEELGIFLFPYCNSHKLLEVRFDRSPEQEWNGWNFLGPLKSISLFVSFHYSNDHVDDPLWSFNWINVSLVLVTLVFLSLVLLFSCVEIFFILDVCLAPSWIYFLSLNTTFVSKYRTFLNFLFVPFIKLSSNFKVY